MVVALGLGGGAAGSSGRRAAVSTPTKAWGGLAPAQAHSASLFPTSETCGVNNFVILLPFKKKKREAQNYTCSEALKETRCRRPLPREAGTVSERTRTAPGAQLCRQVQAHAGPSKSPSEPVFLTANRCSMPLGAVGWAPATPRC